MTRASVAALLLFSAGCATAPTAPRRDALRFEREQVELTLDDTGFHVEGQYVFTRDGDAAEDVLIDFPTPRGTEAFDLEVDGAQGRLVEGGAQFLLSLDRGQHRARVRVRYRQALGPRTAEYVVTTALRWPVEVTEAVFVVNAPRAWGRLESPWPAPDAECSAERCAFTWRFAPFVPTHELAVHFGGT